MSTASTSFACPGCAALLAMGTTRCEHCRIRLTGELATRLWQLDQHIAALRSQREWLVATLRRDDAPDVLPNVVSGRAASAAPGTETRRVLLGLGAICLIAALTAATALIWPALGVGGQTMVLLIVTAAFLAGAVRLQHRLPATADALAAVGVAATGVDLVAGRRLVAPDLGGAASHAYWAIGSLLACAVLAYVASRARQLHSPTVGAVLASYGAVVALVTPSSVDDVALVGLIGSVLSATIVRGAQRLPLLSASARSTALAGGAALLLLGTGASLLGADGRGLGLLCGLALSLAIATAPEVLDSPSARTSCGAVGGTLASSLLVRASVVPLGSWAVVTAGIAAAVLMLVLAAPRLSRGPASAYAFVTSAAVVVQLVAQRTLQIDALQGRNLTDAAIGLGVLAVICVIVVTVSDRVEAASPAAAVATGAIVGAVAEAFGHFGLQTSSDAAAVVASAMFVVGAGVLVVATRVRDVAVATAMATAAGVLAAITVDASLAIRVVRTADPFVIAPAMVAAVLGVLAMRRRSALTSWALLPALVIVIAPTLLLALHGDLTRQVVVLAAAAAILIVGAQGRLVCPLVTGAFEIVLVVGRMVGPEIQQLPRWLTLGVLGTALIGLGSTWEQRMQDVRRFADRLRPAVAALR